MSGEESGGETEREQKAYDFGWDVFIFDDSA